MLISRKCHYALRAVFELASRYGDDVVKVSDIAAAQAIPPRFLEAILGELRQAGFVASRRGASGGYQLARPPGRITPGDVIRFVEGPISPVARVKGSGDKKGAATLDGHPAFWPLWGRAQEAVSAIYDSMSFDDLVEEQRRQERSFVPNFII